MKMAVDGDTLRISEIRELGAANAAAFRDQARAALNGGQKNIEIDMSEAAFVDSRGLGALIALHKQASALQGRLRLVRPQPAVRQLLELTQLDRILEIEKA